MLEAHTWRLFVGEAVCGYMYVLCVYILLFGFQVAEGAGILLKLGPQHVYYM